MYRIALPILGFENFENVKIEKIDDFFSFLVFDEKTKIMVVNIYVLDKVSFDFTIDQNTLDKLKIKSKDDFSTYFTVVSQNPIEFSIVNLISPIFINEKEKIVGQYIITEKVEPFLASIDKCSTL